MFRYNMLTNFLIYLMFVTDNSVYGIDKYATLRWSIGAKGFHRQIHYNLEIVTNNTWKDCNLVIKQTIPSSLYVSKDQLEDLKRLKKVTAIVNDFVDTEMAEDVSSAHNVYIRSGFNKTDDGSILTSNSYLPVHVRYHSPQPDGGFRSATIFAPEIYINCAEIPSNHLSTATIMLPCITDSFVACHFRRLDHLIIDEDVLEVLIPVGNTDHFNIVVLVTYFVTISGGIYIYAVILLNLPKSKKN